MHGAARGVAPVDEMTPASRPAAPPPRPAETAYRDLREQQSGMRHRSAAAMARRWALRRAQGRCEDLAELLGHVSDANPTTAAAGRRAALVVVRDLWRLVAGHRSPPAPGTALSAAALETLVEAADGAIRDAALGVRGADRLAVELAGRLLAGMLGLPDR